MSLSQAVALAAIIIAGISLIGIRLVKDRLRPPTGSFLKLSTLIYLSCAVVAYFIVRYRPEIDVQNVILTEASILGLHLVTVSMILIITRKFRSAQKEAESSQTPIQKYDEQPTDESDVESK